MRKSNKIIITTAHSIFWLVYSLYINIMSIFGLVLLIYSVFSSSIFSPLHSDPEISVCECMRTLTMVH